MSTFCALQGATPAPPHHTSALMLIQTEAGQPFCLSDRAENSGSPEECKANKMNKHWNIHSLRSFYKMEADHLLSLPTRNVRNESRMEGPACRLEVSLELNHWLQSLEKKLAINSEYNSFIYNPLSI